MKPRVLAEGDVSYQAVIGAYLLESRLLQHGIGIRGMTDRKRGHLVFQYELLSRVTALKFAIAELDIPEPRRVLETGHVGLLHTAHAFPEASVICVDGDKGVFSNEINSLPAEYWEREGLGYRFRYFGDVRVADLRRVEQAVPNYRRVVGCIESLPFADASIDLAIALGEPFFSEHGDEVARTVRPGGHLITMLDGWPVNPRRPSFYKTGVYPLLGSVPRLRAWAGWGLEKLEVTDALRSLERICEWKTRGKIVRTGYVFEAFRKP